MWYPSAIAKRNATSPLLPGLNVVSGTVILTTSLGSPDTLAVDAGGDVLGEEVGDVFADCSLLLQAAKASRRLTQIKVKVVCRIGKWQVYLP